VTHATFRVHVDPDRCQGHNRCYSVSPDLFELDDLGMSSEVGTGLVPVGLLSQARLAVANCPEHAISLTELTEAELTEAELTEAELTEAELTEAELTEAELTEAELTEAAEVNAEVQP
jgi:ferredoxin